MTENLDDDDLLIDFLYFFLREECKLGKVTSQKISAQFTNLESFVKFKFRRFKNKKSIDGHKLIRGFNDEMVSKIENLINLINISIDINQNFQQAIGRKFIRNIILILKTLNLEKLNPNPFLIKALNLTKVDELIHFIIYQRADRSMVTSFGNTLEFLVAASGAEKLPKGFDLLKKKENEKYFIQVKSGTSDMDKDQVVYWRKRIDQVEEEGHHGYIGMCYGKRGDPNAVSLKLMEKYLPEWEDRTLVGKELWKFVSGKQDYYKTVLTSLDNAANQIFRTNSIIDEINSAIEKIIIEFKNKFGDDIESFIQSKF